MTVDDVIADASQLSDKDRARVIASIDPPDSALDFASFELWQKVFLAGLTMGKSVSAASEDAGMHQQTPYYRRKTDAIFRRAWDEALNIGTRMLEQEAVRRAYHGVDRPVFFKGEQCGVVREYSDTLLMFLLRGRRPEKYRDNAASGSPGSFVLNVQVVGVSTNSEQDGARVRQAAALPGE
jgi:hypothetical protein